MEEGLTLGVEEELHIVDLRNWRLAPSAPEVLARVDDPSFSSELQRTTVETRTQPTESLTKLREEILERRTQLREAAEPLGLGLAAVGTAPHSSAADLEVTRSGRYWRMRDQYRLLVDEQLICGLQVHVGVADRDLAVGAAQRVSWVLPVLLALSASSPYWNGQDTGYASIRSILWQRWPSAGPTGPLSSAAEYDDLVEDLIRTGVVADAGMAYFDLRPSGHVPTLELRVCDACPIVDDAVMVAGLFRAAVRQALDDISRGAPHHLTAVPLQRSAMWQAARNGLSGHLLEDTPHPRPVEAGQVVHDALTRLRPQLEELGDYEEVVGLVAATLSRGNSADRQRAAFAQRGRTVDAMALSVEETHGPAAGPFPAVEALPGYRTRAGDEAVVANAQPRESYVGIVRFLRGLDSEELDRRVQQGRRWAEEQQMGYVVEGEFQVFAVDLVPRVIQAHEWVTLRDGLIQRAKALEAFLQDVYGEARVLSEGVLPTDLVTGAPGWVELARRLPPRTRRAPLMGFDLVRSELGEWRVLEDNLRAPSGVMYAVATRQLLDAVVPDMPRPDGILDPHDAVSLFRHAVLGPSGPDGTGALLTSGPSSGAWFEHRRLADAAGLLLIGPDDLEVVAGQVVERVSGRVIDALYLRIDDELADLTDSGGARIGEKVFDVAAAGKVFLANAPGNGVADDKEVYSYVPDLIEFYLGERPLLDSVPTHRTRDDGERSSVIERVGELVTKPVDGAGGAGVLIGPDATAGEVAERREVIASEPGRWIAQELVRLSSHPTLVGGQLEPRRVDLRIFTCSTGMGEGEVQVAPLGLTRVAAAGSMVVNSSRGGGGKDTWILDEEHPGEVEEAADVRTGR